MAEPGAAPSRPVMFLAANGPLHLAHTLGSGQAFRWRRQGDAWRGVVEGVVFTVWPAPGGVAFRSEPRPEAETAPVLRSYLRLDDDLPALYARLRRDGPLEIATAIYPGLRLLRQDPWECLVTFVISAYSNIGRITRHVDELCQAFGERVPLAEGAAWAFPAPERLADVGEGRFREMRLGYRARYLARLARAVLDQEAELRSLRARPYAEAKAALLELDGVGEKVADCALAFSLDQGEAFPVDVWVRRAVREWYFTGAQVTDMRIRRWASQHFGPDAAYAQQYLFHLRRLLARPGAGGRRRSDRGGSAAERV